MMDTANSREKKRAIKDDQEEDGESLSSKLCKTYQRETDLQVASDLFLSETATTIVVQDKTQKKAASSTPMIAEQVFGLYFIEATEQTSNISPVDVPTIRALSEGK